MATIPCAHIALFSTWIRFPVASVVPDLAGIGGRGQ
jgi:hypothetical protein